MWRRSSISLLGPRSVSYAKLNARMHQPSLHLLRASSRQFSSSSSSQPPINIPPSMENAKTLEDILFSIEEQSILDDERRALERPTPYYNLLHYPSRAAWRSSDNILGDPPKSSSSNLTSGGRRQVNSLLGQTQFNIIQQSQRTNKQLKRTYKRIMDTHKALALKRERERRLAANSLSSSVGNNDEKSGNNNDEGVDGAIEDGQGRYVGDWREKSSSSKRKNKKNKNVSASASSEALCDDPSVALSLSMGLSSTSKRRNNNNSNQWGDIEYDAVNNNNNKMNVKSAKSANRLAKSSLSASTTSNEHRPVGYGAEQTITNLRYRFGPNYSIVKRVLSEVQSLLGGKPPIGSDKPSFMPKRVLDFGCGVGSSGAAALDVLGVSRSSSSDAAANDGNYNDSSSTTSSGIEWIHSVDASQSMREATHLILQSILQSAPWDEKDTTNTSADASMEDRLLEEEMAQYEQFIDEIRGVSRRRSRSNKKKLERERKRTEKWEHTWVKQDDARTRLTFGESIVDASSFYSDEIKVNKDDRPALPWQAQLDEQRRQAREKKKKANAQQHSSSSSAANQKKQGSFDLILCSYTLSELPSVPSSLAAATLLWEKLANNGILVFVEPGTPDGFGLLRSVRSMLLECCPPPELVAKRRRKMKAAMEAAVMDDERMDENHNSIDSDSEIEEAITSPVDDDIWHEECHVIAPCTHNGTCPMSRHQRNHVKRNTRFGRYEAAAEPNEDVDSEEDIELRNNERAENNEDEDDGDDIRDVLDNWDYMSESDKDELKTMFGGEDMSDDEVKAMLEYMDSEDLDSDEEEEEGVDSDSDYDDDNDDLEYLNIDQETASDDSQSKKASTMAQTDVFDSAFCSFVHKFPGGSSHSKGEKFTYLVLQKRVPSSNDNTTNATMHSEEEMSLDDIDVVEMMSKSVHHGQQLKKEELRMRLQLKRLGRSNADDDSQDPYVESFHQNQANEVLQQAVDVEDAFLDSNVDSLGLEMLTGDDRRKGWGRLIRAPLKRKGHVLIDYCSAGCGGSCTKDDDDDWFEERPDGTQGRITRQKVSRGWSARSAPGCYSAARRARWGGLWPDLVERVRRQDEKERQREKNNNNDKTA